VDVGEVGRLTVGQFYLALRLISHAQTSGIVHADLVDTEPVGLPNFNLSRSRAVSDGSDPAELQRGGPTEELRVLGAAIDPSRMVDATSRREDQNDFVARSQYTLNFNVTEQILYSRIYDFLSPENGEISGPKAASFLESSEVPRPILHELWAICDEGGSGKLNRLKFFILLRLIAHTQASGMSLVNPSLQFIEPPNLPYFESQSFLGNMEGGAAATGGAAEEATKAAEESGAFFIEPLTGKDKRKYTDIFNKTAQDGFVDGAEGKALMERSGLSNEFLAVTWQLGDRDRDGRLSYGEFLVALHIITRCKKGDFNADDVVNLPKLEKALPAHLVAVFDEEPSDMPAVKSKKGVPEDNAENSAGVGSGSPTQDRERSPERERSPDSKERNINSPLGSPALESLHPTPEFSYLSKGGDQEASASEKPGSPQQQDASAFNIHPPILRATADNSRLPNFGGEAAISSARSRDREPHFGNSPTGQSEAITKNLDTITEADRRLAGRIRREAEALEAVLQQKEALFEEKNVDGRKLQISIENKASQQNEVNRTQNLLASRWNDIGTEQRIALSQFVATRFALAKSQLRQETEFLAHYVKNLSLDTLFKCLKLGVGNWSM